MSENLRLFDEYNKRRKRSVSGSFRFSIAFAIDQVALKPLGLPNSIRASEIYESAAPSVFLLTVPSQPFLSPIGSCRRRRCRGLE